MKNTVICKNNIYFLIYTFITTVILSMGDVFLEINQFATGIILISLSIVLYFCLVFFVAGKNWLDIRAVFHGVWVFTIGLASFRLTDYQERWQIKTWLCLALAYLMFQVGSHLGIIFGKTIFDKFKNRFEKIKIDKLSFELNENRYFWICLITTLIGLLCFLINVAIRGYIPCFSNDINAYIKFYTKFHIFAVASTGVSGLCYYCIATQKISKLKKAILLLCILYETFLFPVMVVSRGVFMASALSLTVTVFYVHKKKFLVLIGCLAIIASVYYGTSLLRNYSDEQLEVFFEPSKIEINTDSEDSNTNSEDSNTDSEDSTVKKTFSLPPKVAFIYTYLTVSHDNFNEAVQNSKEYTYGLHQFSPFNTIFRITEVEKRLENAKYYLVRPHLNTVNLIGLFYYDFHEWGVAIFMLLWSFIFGILQKITEFSKTPFVLLALGNAMVPVALCFFAGWMSVFSQWMLWGVVLIFAVASTIKIDTNKKLKIN